LLLTKSGLLTNFTRFCLGVLSLVSEPGMCRIYREAVREPSPGVCRIYLEAVGDPSPGFSLGRLPIRREAL
jgi:hypothetical protein